MTQSNEYMRIYMAQRRATRRQKLRDILGNKCRTCGTQDRLEFDHKIAGDMSFRISGRGLDKPWAVLLLEIAKCQLLCYPCHRIKTVAAGEAGGGHNKIKLPIGIHGSAIKYQRDGCRCAACRYAKNLYRKHLVAYAEVVNFPSDILP